ncbi:tetratricopeptide repeat protein [Pedobacter glucosidilyticus]|uniref:tetratricopeptide repeat protein n=1 Tax=Pedobacter glucosidilyticus TaxID=1122941 RepID=UPI0026EEFC16|nr:tetratricopeptide repeat protein [Pedobacter glucosidilyticus]
MKKLLSSLIALSFCTVAMAQKAEISAAKNTYAIFEVGMQTKASVKKQLETLNTAKASIDKATVHEKTLNSPEAWSYKALIYSAIAVTDTVNMSNADAAFKTAQEAIAKAKELDKEGKEKNNIDNSERNLSIVMQNRGVSAFNKKDYKTAYTSFKYISDVMPTDSLYSMYTAIAANSAQMTDEAIKYYNKTLELNTKNPALYQELGRLYMAKADTANALKVIEAGRALHPNNLNLIYDELNVYLARGQASKQISKIESAIAQEPKNKTLHFVAGVAYASNKQFDKAEEAYNKALEIDPSYADAVYNLAVIYIDRGNAFINQANALPNTKNNEAKYNALKGQFNAQLTKALPLLEKARELNPKDRNVAKALREVYVKLNKLDKAAELKKQLDQM